MRQILSMRYAIENDIISSDEKYSSKGGLAGYEQIMKNGDEGSHGYNVYENKYFIPAGFTFDYYMSESEYESLDVESTLADRLLVHTLILPDDIAEEMQYGNGQTEVSSVAGLQHLDPEGLSVMTIEELEQEHPAARLRMTTEGSQRPPVIFRRRISCFSPARTQVALQPMWTGKRQIL